VAVGSPLGVVNCGFCVSMAAVGLLGGWIGLLSLCEPLPPTAAVSMSAVGLIGESITPLSLSEPLPPSSSVPVSMAAVGSFEGLIASLVAPTTAEVFVEASEGLAPWSAPAT
jgi:hypothetical protein